MYVDIAQYGSNSIKYGIIWNEVATLQQILHYDLALSRPPSQTIVHCN